MKIIYRAGDIVEAHIVAGMLHANDIEPFVGGHYLQGAVGDLAMQGFANVFVQEEDVEAAQRIVMEYEQAACSAVETGSDDEHQTDWPDPDSALPQT